MLSRIHLTDFQVLLGRLHPLVVHLPIGFLMLAIVFELLARFERFSFLKPSLKIIAFFGLLSAVFSCIAGYLLSLSGGYEKELLAWHKWMGIGLAIFSGVYFLIKAFNLHSKQVAYASAVLFFILLSATGHFGGALTHGEDFLNQPILAMLGKKPVVKERKPIANIDQALVFDDVIHPILDQKCVQCHNAQKSKGNLRMDTKELLLKGGEHGKIVVAGNANESELYERLVLPEDDEKRMPPKGKTQITEKEQSLIYWWIKSGAFLDKKVADIPKDENIKSILAEYQSGDGLQTAVAEGSTVEFTVGKLAKPSAEAIASLTELNVNVVELDTANNYLSVNAVNFPSFTDTHANLLLPLREQLVWLNLRDTKITSVAWQTIGQLKNLTRLNLESTLLGDSGLEALKQLKNLQILNLVGTNVNDESVKSLASIKSLKRVYLWRCKISAPTREYLIKQLPECEFNFGDESALKSNLLSLNL